jgi:hypothetical protein
MQSSDEFEDSGSFRFDDALHQQLASRTSDRNGDTVPMYIHANILSAIHVGAPFPSALNRRLKPTLKGRTFIMREHPLSSDLLLICRRYEQRTCRRWFTRSSFRNRLPQFRSLRGYIAEAGFAIESDPRHALKALDDTLE